ncbi:hypothetical protein Tco_0404770 [Tanacetum coccineum]
MVDFVPGRAVIDATHCKRVKYEAKCANIGYGFLPFTFSSLGELEKDAVNLPKWIQKFSVTQDIGARDAVHIFNRINFAIAKGVGNQLIVDVLKRKKVEIACFHETKWKGSYTREVRMRQLMLQDHAHHTWELERVEKKSLWDSLDDIVRVCSITQQLIITGDLNSHIGANANGYSRVHEGFVYGVRN